MGAVELSDGTRVNCLVDDFLWPWAGAVPVFMVHGFARNGRFWDRWVPDVAADRRVYRPEIRGCGESPPPPEDFVFDAERLVEDLVEVMDRLELDRVHWVGERLDRGVYPLGEQSTAAALSKYGVREWCARTIDHRLDTRRADPRLVDWFAEQMARTPARVAAGLTECFGAVDVGDRVEAIAAPALLLAGDASDWVIEQQRATLRRLPRARLEVLADYGHGINVLAPAACVRAAVAFWNDVEAKGEPCSTAG